MYDGISLSGVKSYISIMGIPTKGIPRVLRAIAYYRLCGHT